MGVCAGSRFKCHGTDRTLVKDFTVTTLNMRLECRHIRVYNIAMQAAAKRAEKSQFSLAQSSTERNGINTDLQASARDKHIYITASIYVILSI